MGFLFECNGPLTQPAGDCFRLFLLSRKAIIAIIRLPKDISKANIPMKIEIISYAVIGATSFLMYSGEPVLQSLGGCHSCRECFPKIYFTMRTYVLQSTGSFSFFLITIMKNYFPYKYVISECFAFWLSFPICLSSFENREKTKGKRLIELWVKSRKIKSRNAGIVKSWHFCLCFALFYFRPDSE